MKKLSSIFLFGVFLLLSSCGSGHQNFQPASPTPEYTLTVIPTPDAGKAIITGILKQESGGSGGEPVKDTLMALGNVLENDLATPVMVQLDLDPKFRCTTDANGRFVFEDVPPGKYALFYYHLTQANMLKDPKTSRDLIINANTDQVVDLGTLVYQQLPSNQTTK